MTPALRLALPTCLAFGFVLAGCTGEAQTAPSDSVVEAAPVSQASNIRDISAGDVDELLSGAEGAVVLDVRTPEEFDAGHIDGAINADFLADDFAAAIAELDRDTTYILHCRSGSRSTRALQILEQEGFTSIAHLTAGYDGWKAAQEAE